jgi:antitoxin MazE
MTTSAKAKFEGTVQPWGNSLGIRITRAISDMAHIGRGDKVSIEITEEGMVISRKKTAKRHKLPYTEADLIAGLTPHRAHADELPAMLDHEEGV